MYESPIEIFETSTQHTTRFDEEKETVILNVIHGVGVNVDKKELIKALTYDRQQYKKGYCDGARAFAERLRNEIINKPSEFTADKGTVDFLNGLAHRQNEVLNIIDCLENETDGEG